MRLFFMNAGQPYLRLIKAGAALAAAVLVAGCGNNYRPTVTPVSTSGPSAQPSSYAVVISSNGPSNPGVATIIDYSGDSVMAEAPIGPGPVSFALDDVGADGYTVNSDGTVTNIPISTDLQQKLELVTTLPTTAEPLNMLAPSSGLWVGDLNGNVADVFTNSPQTFKLAIPVAATPVGIFGAPAAAGEREYVLSQGFSDPSGVECNASPTSAPADGIVTPIEISTYTPDPTIPVGKCPVYAVQSPDQQRLFVLNRGDDTITVINSRNNTLDSCSPFVNQAGQTVTCHPTLPLSLTAVANTHITPPNGTAGMANTAGPVYAEYNSATQQLVVANYDGGTISVIDVSLDEYGNDSPTFGTTYTIKVGNDPASVTVLYDGSRAYTANQADGTVSVVNLSSHTVEKTLAVIGHPRTVVSTENSLYGKVYVASPDSPYLTIIETETDLVDTSVLVQGNIVDVRTTTQNGGSQSASTPSGAVTFSNPNYASRIPGYGEPCNLPGVPTPTGTETALQACQAMQ